APFTSAEFSGYAEDCVSVRDENPDLGDASFGGRLNAAWTPAGLTGTLKRVTIKGISVPILVDGCTIDDCFLECDTNNVDLIELTTANVSRITNSTLLVVEGGSGIAINDDGNARSVCSAGNRFNNAGIDADGLGANVTNVAADALLDAADAIDGKTVRETLRYQAAFAAGKVSGARTGTETFKGLDGATDRLQFTTDNQGNRTAVAYDP
ncbi:unnamed protein product, partial [marine sediment metagenome]